RLYGKAAGDEVGYSVAGPGDVDGDGQADLLLGAPYSDAGSVDGGAAYLLLGPVRSGLDLKDATALLVAEAAGDLAGQSVAGAGDVDGDGLADLLVGAYGNDAGGTDAGTTYLLSGPVGGEVDLGDATARMLGEVAGDKAGFAVAGAGDVDGDGLDDVL